MQSKDTFIWIQSSIDTIENAEKIAQYLTEKKIAFCVQISSAVLSVYQWKNSLQKDNEYLLNIKTSVFHSDECCRIIQKLHPYETPEIISTAIKLLNPAYTDWANAQLT